MTLCSAIARATILASVIASNTIGPGMRVRLLSDEQLFRESFSRFPNDEVNGFSPDKLQRLGHEAEILQTYTDRTATCRFDDGVRHDMPVEAFTLLQHRRSAPPISHFQLKAAEPLQPRKALVPAFFSVSSSAAAGRTVASLPTDTVSVFCVMSHSSPISDVLWTLESLLGLEVRATTCARTFKGCHYPGSNDNFPGMIECCKHLNLTLSSIEQSHSLLYRQGPGESNPGRHFADLRLFFELLKDDADLERADFVYCDLPPATYAAHPE